MAALNLDIASPPTKDQECQRPCAEQAHSEAFRNLFRDPKWKVVTVKYNRGKKRLMPLMARLRRWVFFERYFTVNIYAILQHCGRI